MRKVMVWIGAAALLAGLLGSMPGRGSAATLSGGQYTYVINGEEATFSFDPIKVQSTLLLPVEVFQRFDVQLQGEQSRSVTLKHAAVTATVTLGTPTMLLDGEPVALDTSAKAGGVVAGGFFLVNDQRNQYDLESVVDTGAGLITEPITPSADRLGVLVFPRAASTAGLLSLYYDPNGTTLGTFTRIR